MAEEYSLDRLLELRRLLSKYVGEEKASEWVKARFKRNVSYGMPEVSENGKKRYTRYGNLQNIDIRPERYMPPEGATVTFKPNDQWNSTAYGKFSALEGIKMPDRDPNIYSHPPESNLVHEGQHYRDVFSGDEFSKIQSRAQRDKEYGMLGDMAKSLEDQIGYKPGISGQTEPYEVLPQLRSYEAQMPAWSRLQATEFFKNLPNEAKAMLLRRFFPNPKGVDAMVGQGYD